jgi:hypothetical protein
VRKFESQIFLKELKVEQEKFNYERMMSGLSKEVGFLDAARRKQLEILDFLLEFKKEYMFKRSSN